MKGRLREGKVARLAKLTENQRHAYAYVQYSVEVVHADIRAYELRLFSPRVRLGASSSVGALFAYRVAYQPQYPSCLCARLLARPTAWGQT